YLINEEYLLILESSVKEEERVNGGLGDRVFIDLTIDDDEVQLVEVMPTMENQSESGDDQAMESLSEDELMDTNANDDGIDSLECANE
ncbi:MAG TPA: hypothetical protein VKI62_10095, partial [Bacteroidota bacterium]|nr:hypothetical protein [Bacteroidota bacterium]